MSSAEGQSVELQLCLDGEGRTVSAEHKPDGTSNAIDYSSKAVMSELSSPIDITERREIMDDLLFDAEIADCGLLPRTFWMLLLVLLPRMCRYHVCLPGSVAPRIILMSVIAC